MSIRSLGNPSVRYNAVMSETGVGAETFNPDAPPIDFTIELFLRKPNTDQGGLFQISSTVGGLTGSSYQNTIAAAWTGTRWQMYGGGNDTYPGSAGSINTNTWYHLAYVRYNSTTTLYIDGTSTLTHTDTMNYDYKYLGVGGYYSTSYLHEGLIYNFRLTKGQALYTGNFTKPSSPLTTTSQGATESNVKLLCCKASPITAATVTPGSIIVNGDPDPSTTDPFSGDDYSVDFDGTGDYLSWPSSSDFSFWNRKD